MPNISKEQVHVVVFFQIRSSQGMVTLALSIGDRFDNIPLMAASLNMSAEHSFAGHVAMCSDERDLLALVRSHEEAALHNSTPQHPASLRV
jgi:hypothetical protein